MLPKLAFNSFAARYRIPQLKEGFQDIAKVDFMVCGPVLWSSLPSRCYSRIGFCFYPLCLSPHKPKFLQFATVGLPSSLLQKLYCFPSSSTN